MKYRTHDIVRFRDDPASCYLVSKINNGRQYELIKIYPVISLKKKDYTGLRVIANEEDLIIVARKKSYSYEILMQMIDDIIIEKNKRGMERYILNIIANTNPNIINRTSDKKTSIAVKQINNIIRKNKRTDEICYDEIYEIDELLDAMNDLQILLNIFKDDEYKKKRDFVISRLNEIVLEKGDINE